VASIPAGDYTRSLKNKAYGIKAVAALTENPALVDDEEHLWKIAVANEDKTPNYQMDVVTSLWRSNLICK